LNVIGIKVYWEIDMSDVDDYKYSLEKGPESDIVKAAHRMVAVYDDHEMMLGAIDEVHHDFPMIDRDDLMSMWIGINAANQSF